MILRWNETTKDATLTTTSERINAPATNVLDSRLSALYKTDFYTYPIITYDCGEAVIVSSIVIDNHNISETVSVLKLQGNDTDEWTSPAVDKDLTWNEDKIILDFEESTYQFWRVVIDDNPNPDGQIEIGRIWIGQYYKTPGIAVSIPRDQSSRSLKSTSISGVTYGDRRKQRLETFTTYPVLTREENNFLLDTIFEKVDTIVPFYITFDKGGNILGDLYVTINQGTIKSSPLGARDLYTISVGYRQEI